MKVLHIASGDLWAGAEVQVFLLLTELAQHSDTTVHAVLMNNGLLASRLRAAGIAVDILDENELGAIPTIWALRKLLLAYRPDVIHTHRVKENLVGLAANLLAIQAPTVRTIHGANEHPARWSNPIRKIVELVDQLSGRFIARQVIAVSDELATRLRNEHGYRNVIAIPNGIDIERVRGTQQSSPALLADRSARHIGFVGRLEKVKRADIFLHMAAALSASGGSTPLRFHIFGDGSCREELKALSLNLGISSVVEFHGHKPDVVSWLGGLDAIVICSDHEGLPMTLLEAMASGTPVVAHAVGGIIEVMRGDVGGRLVHHQDAYSYAAAITEILQCWTPTDSHVALDRLEKRYSAQLTATLTAEIYADCADMTKRNVDAPE